MLPLKEKTLALLIQLPPSLKITEGIQNLSGEEKELIETTSIKACFQEYTN